MRIIEPFIDSGMPLDEIFVITVIGICIFFCVVFGIAGIVDAIKRYLNERD